MIQQYHTYTLVLARTPEQHRSYPVSRMLVADRHFWGTEPAALEDRIGEIRDRLSHAPRIAYVLQQSDGNTGHWLPGWKDDAGWEAACDRLRLLQGFPEVILDLEAYGGYTLFYGGEDVPLRLVRRRTRQMTEALGKARLSVLMFASWNSERAQVFRAALPRHRTYIEDPYVGGWSGQPKWETAKRHYRHFFKRISYGISPQFRNAATRQPWSSVQEFADNLRWANEASRHVWLYNASIWWDTKESEPYADVLRAHQA